MQATLTVECVVKIPDHIDPNAVTLDIPVEQVRVMDGEKVVGTLQSYCTQEYVGE